MGSATSINVRRVEPAGVGTKEWIPMNRYAPANATINLTVPAGNTVTIQGTLVRVNRNTPVADDVFDLQNLTDITGDTALSLPLQPLEAVRVNQTAGTGNITIQIQQAGL